MERKILLLFSHKLTAPQLKEAEKRWSVTKLAYLPEKLQSLWSNIPPETNTISQHLQTIRDWIQKTGEKGDFILIQGDFGATCLMVQYAFQLGLIPVYATTKRTHQEEKQPDNSINVVKSFKHVQFRRYEK